MMKNKWMALGLGAFIGLGGLMISCGDDSSETEKDTASLRFLQSSAQITKGTKEKIQLEYKFNNVGKEGDVIALSHSNPTCIKVMENVTTTAGGIATVEVEAGNAECETDLTATSPDEPTITRTLKIVVADTTIIEDNGDDNGDDNVTPGTPVITVIEPANKNLYINVVGATEKIVVKYADDSKVVTDARLNIKSSDDSCAAPQVKSAITNSEGKASINIISKKEDCEAKIEISSENKDVKAVTVTAITKEVTEFSLRARAKLDSPKIDDITHATIGVVKGNCSFLQGKLPEDFKMLSFDLLRELSDVQGTVSDNYLDPKHKEFPRLSVADAPYAAIAYATIGELGPVIAFGCTDGFDRSNNEQDIILSAVPTDFKGTYNLTANFDFTSGFTKTPGEHFPVVEEMLAGDWVQFTADFFEEPIDALLNLIWTNSIVRLKDIDGLPDFIKDIVADGTMRTLITNTLKPIIMDYFKGEDGEENWFTIFNKVSPDVADLIANMQFAGKIDVSEVDGQIVQKANQQYDAVQYRWSYNKNGCIPRDKVYGDDPCRVRLGLTKTNGLNITGDWKGSIDESSNQHDGLLTVNSHPITFKWASILYTVAFGEILPKAFGYETYPSVKNGQYIKSLLEFFLFDKLNVYYATEHPTYVFRQTESCERFIEVLLLLLKDQLNISNEGIFNTAVDIAAPFACGENGIGKLEVLVQDSLEKVQTTTSNGFIFSSNNCALTAEGTKYENIGTKDNPTYTANDVFKPNGNKTNRCIWDVNFSINENPIKLNALFHADRVH